MFQHHQQFNREVCALRDVERDPQALPRCDEFRALARAERKSYPDLVTSRPPCDEAAIGARPCRGGASSRERRAVLVAAVLGSSLVFMDRTIVNVALPTLQRELGATIVEVQWVVEAYALFLSALLLVGGALGDRFGRRRMFAAGHGRVLARVGGLRPRPEPKAARRRASAQGSAVRSSPRAVWR